MEENNNGRLARIADVFLSLSRKQLTSTVMRLIIKLCSTNRALLRTPLTIHSRSSQLLLSYLSLFLSPPRCFTFIVPQRETRKYRGNSEESGRNKELGLSLSPSFSLSFSLVQKSPASPGQSGWVGTPRRTATAFVPWGMSPGSATEEEERGTSRERRIRATTSA